MWDGAGFVSSMTIGGEEDELRGKDTDVVEWDEAFFNDKAKGGDKEEEVHVDIEPATLERWAGGEKEEWDGKECVTCTIRGEEEDEYKDLNWGNWELKSPDIYQLISCRLNTSEQDVGSCIEVFEFEDELKKNLNSSGFIAENTHMMSAITPQTLVHFWRG